MAAPTNHYKLGLFVLLGFGLAIAAAVLLGVASTRKETVKYHSYFNESVQGLDLGSPVKFRGVTIGNVSAIEIAPDHRMVDVVSELDTAEIKRMGLTEAGVGKYGKTKFAVPPDLRAQLGSQGITGVKFIAIDFFDVKSNPPPELPFTAPKDHYIPAAPSMMKNLEDTITKAMDRLPEMVDAVVMIMGRVDRMLAVLEKENVAGKATSTLGHADEVMMTLQTTLTRIDKQDLGGKAAGTITDLNKAVNKMSAVLERLDGDKGLLASIKGASDSFGERGKNGRGTQRDLEATLRDVSEAAEAIRTLAESLDRDPDMLIKGKTKVKAAR
ncbi:MAG: phospholipid/cholesterol/gamma-HCH transport system substrate-binding protein [Myxococcales bacterium]|nr:phospholipid/cholesterol/gamma-HCH transport system substrate-binding protein [Myxococcales bacterium]